MLIDYQDISNSEVIRLINEAAVLVENAFIKEAYKFEFFIQIDLTVVNGLTLKSVQETKNKLIREGSIKQGNNPLPIANVFFKVFLYLYKC